MYAPSASSCARTLIEPIPRRKRTAAPKPIVASMAGVPASKRNGDVARARVAPRPRRASLSATMPPPTWYEREAREVLGLAPEDADAARAEGLVRARGEEIDAQRAHVERQVAERLRGVEQHRDAARVGGADDLVARARWRRSRWTRAPRRRASFGREHRREPVPQRDSVPIDAARSPASRGRARAGNWRGARWRGRRPRPRARGPSPCATRLIASVVPRTKTTSLGACADERRGLEARRFVGLGGFLAEEVHAAVHVGGGLLVVAAHRVDDHARLGRRRRAVEEDERAPVVACARAGEIRLERRSSEGARHVDGEGAPDDAELAAGLGGDGRGAANVDAQRSEERRERLAYPSEHRVARAAGRPRRR